MIRHVVSFTFREDTNAEQRAQLLGELRDLPNRYPAMRHFALGRNISRRDATYDYAFSAEFDDEKDLVEYLESDTHEKFVATRFRPLVERRAIVSFED
jgi:2,3-dihydroxy-p-cumate/2,3-dihydroxybenzoate 3,4-dioxygenase